jgi:alpha-L-fucosidase
MSKIKAFFGLILIVSMVFTFQAFQQKDIPEPRPLFPIPSAKQLAWHDMEMNAFVHFTTNTFTDLEWGYGDESTTIFNPTAVNTDQWLSTLKNAGFKGVILTCKHHDGFCLWPSKYTEHSVKKSPYKDGKGDIVKDVSLSAKKYGLKFGVYLSPWDRNSADYGKPEYVTYYRNQVKEIFSNYGPIFEMWFDGANGGDGFYGGAKEKRNINKKTYYDWPKTLDLVRGMQPNVSFFSDAGPDIRWVGNESGTAGLTNWAPIVADTLYAGMPNAGRLLNTGSENGNKWIPSEVDVSIRPGWFYHAKEDDKVKTPQRLFEIYLTSVGRGSTLLLNIPPDRRGLFHENDVAALQGFKKLLDQEFKTNLALKAKVTASSYRGKSAKYAAVNTTDGRKDTYWATDDNQNSGNLEVNLGKLQTVKYIVVQEYIKLGQRVKSFNVEVWKDNAWKEVATATTIGHKRILRIDPAETEKIRINIKDAKACPVISNIEVY